MGKTAMQHVWCLGKIAINTKAPRLTIHESGASIRTLLPLKK
jgi:hypothetical protein